MTVVTRFAPSPTGFLHIGGARTALFNWLYAKNKGGKFLLRIEDTDKKRSTKEATDAILEGMDWLGLKWDDEIIYQTNGEARHKEIAEQLLKEDKAYYCYCTPEELTEMREKAQSEKKPFRYDRRWRDSSATPPDGVKPVIRFKAPLEGETIIEDAVQGKVTVQNSELDDLIILRSDGTPTYMLAVVVDDHDMGVTHAIRGDDHLTNAFKQKAIFEALGWQTPEYSHIPLIHGADGAKLSKRHGALGVDAYRDMGYLPEAIRNYLLRLGWSHGDDEIISDEQAIEWFNLESVGKSPARFDFTKLASVNFHYIKEADNDRLADLISARAEKKAEKPCGEIELARIIKGMNGLKDRAKTLNELADSAAFYISRPEFDEKSFKIINEGGSKLLTDIIPIFQELEDWTEANIFATTKSFGEKIELKLGKVAQPLRAALTGSTVSPSVFEIMDVLGKEESLKRLGDF